jgi:hypothetical protein
MQSRGKVPVPNWIFARLLQTRRSLLRLFAANILITYPSRPLIGTALDLQRIRWDMLCVIARN